MPDSDTLWLTVTNAALGVGVGLCVLAAAIGLVYEIVVQRKRRRIGRELDRDCGPQWR